MNHQQLKVSVYELSSGLHQVSYRDPLTRKRVRKKFTGSLIAKNYSQKIRRIYLANGLNPDSLQSVSQMMLIYLKANPRAFIKSLGKPVAEDFLCDFGHVPVMDVTEESFSTWLWKIQQNREYSDRTLPNIKSAIKQFFDFLVDTKILKINPVASIIIKKGSAKNPHVKLTEDEVLDLLTRIKKSSPDLVYPVSYFLAQTGARLGEALTLKWADVSFGDGTAHLRQTKNGDDRLIRLSSSVLDFLKNLPRFSDTVFSNFNDEPWTVNQYRKQFTKIRRKICFPKRWTNHAFRHSYAHNFLKQGGNMISLQHHLGHRGLKMTVDLYGKITASDVTVTSPFDF